MNFITTATALSLILTTVAASNYDGYIEHLINRNKRLHEDHISQYPEVGRALDDLYANQVDAIPAPNDYEGPDEEDYDSDDHWSAFKSALDNVRRYKNAEVPSQNNLWGEHKVSGGAGKGSQVLSGGIVSKPEVKTDKLPAYCDPPNPCPVGMDPDSAPSPCDKHIPDTKEFNKKWIVRKMKNGECPCDGEHMKHCSKSYRTMDQRSFDKATEDNNPYLSGNKRMEVVAKKAPTMLSDRRKEDFMEKKRNPYFEGDSLKTVKKKDGRNLRPYM